MQRFIELLRRFLSHDLDCDNCHGGEGPLLCDECAYFKAVK